MSLLRELVVENYTAFKGVASSGTPILTTVGGFRVYTGVSVSGSPLYTVSGNKLFSGMATSGMPLATLVGDLVFPKNSISGEPLGRLKNKISVSGISGAGSALATVPSGNIPTLFAATYHVLRG